MAETACGKNLPFIISMGTIVCDVLVNLFCNDISNVVQQSTYLVTRFTPYIVWFTLILLWVLFKGGMKKVSYLRKYEPFVLFVGTVLCDVLINLFCSDISRETQQQTFEGERYLPYAVLSATALLWFVVKRMLESRPHAETRQSGTQRTATPHGIFQLNDSVWEFHAPNCGTPEMDVIFFHGLALCKDSFWKTWLVRDTDQVVWPKEWLGTAYPNARIISISYYHAFAAAERHGERHGELDQDLLNRNLVKDIILAKHLNIGQNCPVILIGHSVGGIVIKDFLLTAASMKRAAVSPITNRVNTFLGNIRGLFYYGITDESAKIEELAKQSSERRTLLLTIVARRLEINEEFRQRTELHARSFAVLEGRKTNYMRFHHLDVGEARSVRYEVDKYIDMTSDHSGVCRPASKESAAYTILQQFIASSLADGMIRQYAGLVIRRFLPGFGVGGVPNGRQATPTAAFVGTTPNPPASKEATQEPQTVSTGIT